jgi:sulfatase modifying factor 1
MILLPLLLHLGLSDAHAGACPPGRTDVGCSPAEMDAYGCCPIRTPKPNPTPAPKPAKPAVWGQLPTAAGCAVGLAASPESGGRCCWPGQVFNGVTCLGAPVCPTPYVAVGNGCELGACDDGQVRAPDGLHCCWEGQTFSLDVGDCVGAATCPPGSRWDGATCRWELVHADGPARSTPPSPTLGPLIWIPPGTFLMGAGTEEMVHRVALTTGRWIMRSEVTVGMWNRVTGDERGWGEACGETCPAADVSWLDAVAFANAASARDGLPPAYQIQGSQVTWIEGSRGWRLPTEAEWEYAARLGGPPQGAWFDTTSDGEIRRACSAGADALGLCDLLGSVWEWVWDWQEPYAGATVRDPRGPFLGARRGLRGGSWSSLPTGPMTRSGRSPAASDDDIGMRLVRDE